MKAHEIADGVWQLLGNPGHLAVYFIRDGDGVLMFDAGGKRMVKAIQRESAALGGLTRIVLGHAHTDHRGSAPALGVPVFCHPAEVQDAAGSGGRRYWGDGRSTYGHLPLALRIVHPLLHRLAWDGGPVTIAGTLVEGDEVAGFQVIELPGHAPGQIGLWREADRLALVTDAIYLTDMWGRTQTPARPLAGYSFDDDQAAASLRKLAALAPRILATGHKEPLVGDQLPAILLAAADRPAA